VLIDGAELFALMVRNAVGVRTRTVYEIKRVDEDYFSE
jgi:restriction endonuclease Mrr